MADPVLDLWSFSVGGKTQGTISLPCDGGLTQITISVTMRARLDGGAVVVIPVWLGELGIFDSDDLIKDAYTLINNTKNRRWVYQTKNYTLHCSKGCKLTPGGPATAKYTVDDDEMTITCGYFNRFGTGFPFIGWWYSSKEVTVKCSNSAKGITYAMLDDSKLDDLLVAKKLDDLALAVAKGGESSEIIVNENGVLISTVAVENDDGSHDCGCSGKEKA